MTLSASQGQRPRRQGAWKSEYLENRSSPAWGQEGPANAALQCWEAFQVEEGGKKLHIVSGFGGNDLKVNALENVSGLGLRLRLRLRPSPREFQEPCLECWEAAHWVTL